MAGPYTIPTGDGYVGVYRVHDRAVTLALGVYDAVDWQPGDQVWIRDDGDRLTIVDEQPDGHLEAVEVRHEGNGPTLKLGTYVGRLLDVDDGEDVRAYARPTGGLWVVPRESDPLVDEAEVATDDGDGVETMGEG